MPRYDSGGAPRYDSVPDDDYRKGDYRRVPSIGNITEASSDGGSLWSIFKDLPRLKAGLCVCIVNSATCCGQSCMMAPFAELLLQRACERHDLTFPSSACDDDTAAQAEAARRLAYYSLSQQIPNLLTVGLVGTVSDSLGRHKGLMIPLVTGIAATLAVAMVPTGEVCFVQICVDDGFFVLLGITALSSCGGGQLAILASSFAVVADITEGRPPETIALCFGLAELWLFLGLMLGPTLAGILAQHYSLQQSFYLGVGCFIVATLAVLLLMRDLRPASARPAFKWGAVNPIRSMALLLSTSLSRCFFVMLAAGSMAFGMVGVTALYLTDLYDFTPELNGYWQSTNFAAGAAGLLLGMPLLQRCFSLRAIFILTNFTAMTSGYLFYAALPLIKWRGAPYVVAGCNLLNQIPTPCIRACVTQHFGTARYGLALASIAAVQTLFNLAGNELCPQLYAEALALGHPEWAYLFGAGLAAIVLGAALQLPSLEVVPAAPEAEVSTEAAAEAKSRAFTKQISSPEYRRSLQSRSASAEATADDLKAPLVSAGYADGGPTRIPSSLLFDHAFESARQNLKLSLGETEVTESKRVVIQQKVVCSRR